MVYLEKLKSVSNGSKYEKWYCSIIIAALNRTLGGYGEKHHILPKSFNMGGKRDKLNIVILTPKEHYVCHQLLVKMVKDKKLYGKCCYAAWGLSNRLGYKSSRLYEKNKIAIIGLTSKTMTEYYKDPKNREYMSNKTKETLKNTAYYKIAVETLRKTHENIDHTTKEWTTRSFNSPESLRKSKEYSKTEENSKKCSERELAKGKEALTAQAKKGVQVFRNSFESEEAYRTYLGNINKGRKRIVNLATLEAKQTKDNILPDGFVFWATLSKQKQNIFSNSRNCRNLES